MPNIRITMSVHHDATDPAANDTTLDLSDLIIEKIFKDLEDLETIERGPQYFIIQFSAPVENPSQYHVEP